MARFVLTTLVVVLLVAACQPEAVVEEVATATLPNPTATPTLPSPTDTPSPPTETPLPTPEPVVLSFERTNAVLLVVSNEFDPVEFNNVHIPLVTAGYDVVVGAYTLEPMPDNEGGPMLAADILLSDVRVADYDAVVFIGNESTIYSNNAEAHRIARETVESGRALAALCHGPLVLARAGLLEGRQVTAWFGFGSDVCRQLQRDGAICTYARVQQDGLIITGKGPDESSAFAGAILRYLGE